MSCTVKSYMEEWTETYNYHGAFVFNLYKLYTTLVSVSII